ncbi:MAG TPA: peptidylprolyl isomerase [Acidobacteriaceae bacterium]|jgi:peptidyl-prolyl cis-trans isomerase C|nr:peptidylprolyl isomerase [Acidobacteriaceae bacterium]
MLARLPFARSRWLGVLIVLLALPPAALAQSSGAQKTAAPDPVMARVDGFAIHGSDVMAQIHRLPAQTQQMPLEKLVPMMVEALVNTHLLQAAADKDHLQDDPEVKQRLAATEQDIVRSVYIERLVGKDVSDAKLHAEYDKAIKTMPQREEIEARHILVKTEAEAKQIIKQLERGADFAKLAREKSIDPAGKDSGGDLGWFTKDQMVPEFANAAFALKKGEFTKTPVKTRFGWHVIKLVDRRAAPPPTFEEAKRQLQTKVETEAIAAKVKELRAAAKIEIMGADGKPVAAGDTAAAPAGSSEATPAKKKR